jgi:hypothetical protein
MRAAKDQERWLLRRSVLLTAISADEIQIEASFCQAIRLAEEQKSVSLENIKLPAAFPQQAALPVSESELRDQL